MFRRRPALDHAALPTLALRLVPSLSLAELRLLLAVTHAADADGAGATGSHPSRPTVSVPPSDVEMGRGVA
jgi:hypothetical protein